MKFEGGEGTRYAVAHKPLASSNPSMSTNDDTQECQQSQLPRNRRLMVAIKTSSIKRPTSASAAPMRAIQSPSGSVPGKKPRPWKEVMLRTNDSSQVSRDSVVSRRLVAAQ